MPLNPSWKVSSIERVDLMIQAIPLQGGVPAVNQTTLMIDSVVELDISITRKSMTSQLMTSWGVIPTGLSASK